MPDKIVKRFDFPRVAFLIFLICLMLKTVGQSSAGLQVTNKYKAYLKQVEVDPEKQMIELKSIIPGINYDLRYATKNNFTREILYKSGENTFMRLRAAEALKKVQEELSKKGYGLKIFDAYRPHSATKMMWELVKDERYVANPAKGSNHNRGLAVDLTIIDLKSGEELDMGTGFDNFTDTAHHDFKKLPADALSNRKLLRDVMESQGFKTLETEWWHYSWPNDKNYEVLDISFGKLNKKKH